MRFETGDIVRISKIETMKKINDYDEYSDTYDKIFKEELSIIDIVDHKVLLRTDDDELHWIEDAFVRLVRRQ